MNILFIDAKYSENYDYTYMESHSLRGTESTVLRLARELAREHNVYISQINRTEQYIENDVTFIHGDTNLTQNQFIPDIIIIIHKTKLLKDYSLVYPQAKIFVWSHNFSSYEVLGRRHRIVRTNAQVICISECHQHHINKILNGYFSWVFLFLAINFKKTLISYIYNTIDSNFTHYNGQINSNKRLFLSSTNEGIDNKEQLVNAESSKAVVDKILNWQQNGRPKVSCQEKFQIY